MTLLRITNGFDKLNDANFEVKANSILASMTGNPNFPTPTPTLAEMQTYIGYYTTALAKAKSGSSMDKADKNAKREALIVNLHALGSYVLFASNGDALAAQSSGFSIARNPSPSPELTPATNLVLEDGVNAGELKLSFDKVQGARSYLYEYTQGPVTDASIWLKQSGTIRKTVISSLESGKKYWCRVVAIGINGQEVYSDPVSRLVQ